MRGSILSAFVLSCLLVNAAPTQFNEPVSHQKRDIAGNPDHYIALAHQKRQDGSLMLFGPGGGVSIASVSEEAINTATASLPLQEQPQTAAPALPTSRTSFLANPAATKNLVKNPKKTMRLDSQSSSTTSTVESSSAQPTSTSTSSSAAPSATQGSALHGPVSGSYYPDWSADVLPPAAVDFSKFNLIYFGKPLLSLLYIL